MEKGGGVKVTKGTCGSRELCFCSHIPAGWTWRTRLLRARNEIPPWTKQRERSLCQRGKTKKTFFGRQSWQPRSTLPHDHQWWSLGDGIRDVMSSTMEQILREAHSERLQRGRVKLHCLPACQNQEVPQRNSGKWIAMRYAWNLYFHVLLRVLFPVSGSYKF